MPAHRSNRLPCRIKLATLLGLIFFLGSCSWGPSPEEQIQSTTQRAEQLVNQGQLEEAARIYWKAAEQQSTPYREQLQLMAVETLLTDSTRDKAREYLSRLDEQAFSGELLVRKRILEARVALLFGRPDLALEALPPGLSSTAPGLTPEVEEVRAQALLLEGDILNSVETRIQLGRHTLDDATRRANADAIWRALNQASPAQLTRWSTEVADPEVQGWVELAYLAKTAPSDPESMRQALDDWERRHPSHPAAPRFIELAWEEWRAFQFHPARITVLLPLSGRYSALGRSVLIGITAAHYASGGDTPATLQVVDVGEAGTEVQEAYRRAIGEGTDAVIGPLLKRQISLLRDLGDLAVPTLTLNSLPDEEARPAQLFEFGLAPEDEAREAATRMGQDGRSLAIGFAPDSSWGQRVLEAFNAGLEAAGGQLLDEELLASGASDFSDPIRHALLIDQSEQRLQSLKNLLRAQIEFEPRRRQDVQAIFVASTPRLGRQLRPQLAYFYAGDLPVYATSHIYSGTPNRQADADLNGIQFCDSPWVIDGDEATRALKEQVHTLYPEQETQFGRLVALGIDAYGLLPTIKRLSVHEYERYPGVTGQLWIDSRHHVHRALPWARFVDGVPQLLAQPPREVPSE